MESPIVASAAATTMMKNTNICASPCPKYVEKATNNKLTEFNINSTLINTMMAFLLTKTPITPMANNIVESTM